MPRTSLGRRRRGHLTENRSQRKQINEFVAKILAQFPKL
jgi:hypothetical protein